MDASYQLEEITKAKLELIDEACIIWKWGKIEEITTSAVSGTVQSCSY